MISSTVTKYFICEVRIAANRAMEINRTSITRKCQYRQLVFLSSGSHSSNGTDRLLLPHELDSCDTLTNHYCNILLSELVIANS